jgi:hypothetical protein
MRTSPRRFRKYIAEAATGMSDPVDRVRNQNTKTPIRWTVNEGWVGRQIWRTDGVGNGRALGCEDNEERKVSGRRAAVSAFGLSLSLTRGEAGGTCRSNENQCKRVGGSRPGSQNLCLVTIFKILLGQKLKLGKCFDGGIFEKIYIFIGSIKGNLLRELISFSQIVSKITQSVMITPNETKIFSSNPFPVDMSKKKVFLKQEKYFFKKK